MEQLYIDQSEYLVDAEIHSFVTNTFNNIYSASTLSQHEQIHSLQSKINHLGLLYEASEMEAYESSELLKQKESQINHLQQHGLELKDELTYQESRLKELQEFSLLEKRLYESCELTLNEELKKSKQELMEVKNQFEQAQIKMNAIYNDKCELEEICVNLESQMIHLKQDLKQTGAECFNMTQSNQQLQTKVAQLENHILDANQHIEHLQQETQQKSNACSSLEQQVKNQELQITNLQSQSLVKDSEISTTTRELQNKSDRLEEQSIMIRDCKLRISDLETVLESQEETNTRLTTQIQEQSRTHEREVNRYEQSRISIQSELDARIRLLGQYQTEMASLKKNMEQREMERQQLQSTNQSKEAELIDSQIKIQQLTNNLNQLSNRNQLLESEKNQSDQNVHELNQLVESMKLELRGASNDLSLSRSLYEETAKELTYMQIRERQVFTKFQHKHTEFVAMIDKHKTEVLQQNLIIGKLNFQNELLQCQVEVLCAEKKKVSGMSEAELKVIANADGMSAELHSLKNQYELMVAERQNYAKTQHVLLSQSRDRIKKLKNNLRDSETEVKFLEGIIDRVRDSLLQHGDLSSDLKRIRDELCTMSGNVENNESNDHV
ncbi:hypothetical protein AKO1_004320 [Acrasis kona]|uniref:Uncharacterized protein n=1 Tax=Acrasis kona TaxID=1008807 RepID=A0AAW2Z7S3_9EUKA